MKQSTIKAEFHCHTVYSPDSLVELETLLKACDERGIDKIAITDHGCLQGALKAYQLDPERVIVAEEIETPEGELLGYFMTEEIPQGLPAVEVVRRLSPSVRDRRASYDRSLDTLRQAARMRPGQLTKSSIMVGLGETPEEVRECLRDLREAGVRLVTLGQYLRPTTRNLPVVRYVPPEEFAELDRDARAMGFEFVASGPLVRSSYRAAELFVGRRLASGAGGMGAAEAEGSGQ